MELKEVIYKRRSIRKYKDDVINEETLNKINEIFNKIKPLKKDIEVKFEIVNRESVKCFLPWITNYNIVVYSENKEGYLENVGFMMQQVDLFLQSMGIGSCWLGFGKVNPKIKSKTEGNLEFIMMMTFGYPKDNLYRDIKDFNRKSLDKIGDIYDERLEPARLAPSSVNNQPWYFTHENNNIHVYCALKGLFTTKSLEKMHVIDVGIAISHMYISNEETFKYFVIDNPKEIKGYKYIGTFNI